jgi:hypothetical protein
MGPGTQGVRLTAVTAQKLAACLDGSNAQVLKLRIDDLFTAMLISSGLLSLGSGVGD